MDTVIIGIAGEPVPANLHLPTVSGKLFRMMWQCCIMIIITVFRITSLLKNAKR